MRGFAGTVTAKELAKVLAPHNARKPDPDTQGVSDERLPEIGADNPDDRADDGKHEEQR